MKYYLPRKGILVWGFRGLADLGDVGRLRFRV